MIPNVWVEITGRTDNFTVNSVIWFHTKIVCEPSHETQMPAIRPICSRQTHMCGPGFIQSSGDGSRCLRLRFTLPLIDRIHLKVIHKNGFSATPRETLYTSLINLNPSSLTLNQIELWLRSHKRIPAYLKYNFFWFLGFPHISWNWSMKTSNWRFSLRFCYITLHPLFSLPCLLQTTMPSYNS